MSRQIVENILGREDTRKIWTANFENTLPMSIQTFELSAVLPAVFYMFRFGQRRGKGKFQQTFSRTSETQRRKFVTIEDVAEKLSQIPALEGFRGQVEQAILGDLLLCYCIENSKRALGRTEKIQRVSPAHYISAWIDLPEKVANLRYVPEMMVAMLADQSGDFVEKNRPEKRSWFAVGRGFEDNLLLRAFSAGMRIQGELASRTSDKFDEQAHIGIDQLLMIRLAQQLGEAPDKLRGGEGERISNQRPIAEVATRHFSEDIRRFVRAYAGVIPRKTLVVLLESCMAVGLSTVLSSVTEILLHWANTGAIPRKVEQHPMPLLVDASNGTNRELRSLAEHSFDDYLRRVERIPVLLMLGRLLDLEARYDRKLKEHAGNTRPYATEWLTLLGSVLHEQHEESARILERMDHKAQRLAEALRDEAPEKAALLEDTRVYPNPAWRLAEALTQLLGRANTLANLLEYMDASLLVDRPNGLAAKRRAQQADTVGGRKSREIRSLVFTDAVLDYLVHLQLLPSGNCGDVRRLSFKQFLRDVQDRYGFCVDQAPPDMTISNDLLQANRAILERRLRDLGLLTGVNDAEAMKRLNPRFSPREENGDAID